MSLHLKLFSQECKIFKIRFTNFTLSLIKLLIFQVVEPTNKVTLNSVRLDIKSASFVNLSGNETKAKEIELQPEDETVTIHFPEALPLGKSGYLQFEFNGQINQDAMKGFYRTKYTGYKKLITYFSAV